MGHNTAEIFYKKLFAELLEMSARDTELQRYLQVSKAIEWADSYDTLMSTRESDPKLVIK